MTNQNSVSKNAKALAFFVFIGGLVALFYGGYTLYARVYSVQQPFVDSGLDPEQFAAVSPEVEQERLKSLDTDFDTLSDYDEINIYNTSPYLPDTDSDGLSDSFEIKQGTDPNCPPDRDCIGIRLVTGDTKISDIFPQFSESDISLKDKTVQEFRQIILDEGYDPETLQQISDEELLIILEETLKYQDEVATDTQPAEEIDYDEVRLFLIDLGVPEDEVYNLSNVEIQELLETLQ